LTVAAPDEPPLRVIVIVPWLTCCRFAVGPLSVNVPGWGVVIDPSHVTMAPPLGVTERPEKVQIVSPVDFLRLLLWAETGSEIMKAAAAAKATAVRRRRIGVIALVIKSPFRQRAKRRRKKLFKSGRCR
jgi:hypothetical protein